MNNYPTVYDIVLPVTNIDHVLPSQPTNIDVVNHPPHYTTKGIECIEVTEQFNFCRGNAIRYIWRAGEKDKTKEIEDLKKAVWYLNREIQQLEKKQNENI